MDTPDKVPDFIIGQKIKIEGHVELIIEYYEQELEFLRQDNAKLEKKLKIIKEKAINLESKLG